MLKICMALCFQTAQLFPPKMVKINWVIVRKANVIYRKDFFELLPTFKE